MIKSVKLELNESSNRASAICFFYPRELDDLDGRDLENQLLLGEIHQHFHVGTLVIAKEQINLDDDEEDDLEEYEDLEDEYDDLLPPQLLRPPPEDLPPPPLPPLGSAST